jgi:DNA polymerase II large subunit
MSEVSASYTIMEQIDDGVDLIDRIIKKLKKPADKDALNVTKETLDTIKKQYKVMKKDEGIRMQYEDKVAYSTIQLMFQVFHLAILSNIDEEFADQIIAHIKQTDNVYELAKRIKAAAEARADFGPIHKGRA